jgi:WD40 repeat protein
VKLLDTEKVVVTQTWDADSVGDAVERPTSRFLLSVTRMLAVAFSADGKTVSGESDHGEIKFWDHRTGEVKRQLNAQQDEPMLVAASLDGKSFAEVSGGQLFFWNANSEAKQQVPLAAKESATAIAVSRDGQMLAVASRSAITLVSPSGVVANKLEVEEGVIDRVAFSIDGRQLAGADQFGKVRIWGVMNGRIERTVTTRGEITAMAFAPGGHLFATADGENDVSIWNLQTGQAQGKLRKHDAAINALAFSPNGQMLASGSDDRTIVLWDLAAGKSKRTFKGHDQTVTSLAFSPDGRLLASGSGNASVVVWEVGTGRLSRVLR